MEIRSSVLPAIKSSSEVYGTITVSDNALAGVRIAGIVGDQQAALVGNQCLHQGEAKNTYGTGAFLLFNTGYEVVKSKNGLISTVIAFVCPRALLFLCIAVFLLGCVPTWTKRQTTIRSRRK